MRNIFKIRRFTQFAKKRRAKINGVSSSYYHFNDSCQILNLSMIFERYHGYTEGTFVEVGAYDGITFSNTSGLALRNWTGFFLEPDPVSYQKCKTNYKNFEKITVSNLAVSSSVKKANLFRQGPLSTLSSELHEKYKDLTWTAGEPDKGLIEVKCVTLNEYLNTHLIDPGFSLLVVDVEGLETEVFNSVDLAYWCPKIIIVELADLHPDFPHLEVANVRLRKQIESHGYSIIYKDHINTIFVLTKILDAKLLGN